MVMRSVAVPVLFVSVLLGAMLWHVPTASAQTEYVDVPGAAFPLGANTSYLESFGMIQGDGEAFVKAGIRLKPQHDVCRLQIWVHDNDVNDVTARLMRKQAVLGAGLGPAPELMASVSSSGAADTLRVFGTTAITGARIDITYVYWVELDFAGGPIQVLSVRVRTRPPAQPTC